MNKVDVVLLPAARRRYVKIWQYTSVQWGEDQANHYLEGLLVFLETLKNGKKKSWRKAGRKYDGLYKVKYKKHFVFFRELSNGRIAVLTILHQNMDIPQRLLDDLK